MMVIFLFVFLFSFIFFRCKLNNEKWILRIVCVCRMKKKKSEPVNYRWHVNQSMFKHELVKQCAHVAWYNGISNTENWSMRDEVFIIVYNFGVKEEKKKGQEDFWVFEIFYEIHETALYCLLFVIHSWNWHSFVRRNSLRIGRNGNESKKLLCQKAVVGQNSSCAGIEGSQSSHWWSLYNVEFLAVFWTDINQFSQLSNWWLWLQSVSVSVSAVSGRIKFVMFCALDSDHSTDFLLTEVRKQWTKSAKLGSICNQFWY